MATHLILYAADLYAVEIARHTLVVHFPFGHQEERDALCTRWGVWEPGQYAVHDIVNLHVHARMCALMNEVQLCTHMDIRVRVRSHAQVLVI